MNLNINKILDQFNSLSDQIRYAVLGGVVLLILILDVVFLVLPQIGSIGDINNQITKLSDDTKQVIVDRQRVNLLRKNLKMTRDQLESLSAKVRPIQEVPIILSTISSIANDYGIKIDQLVPEKSQQETLTSDAGGRYFGLPIVIKAHGGYHTFGHFLNKLENDNLYFIVKDFMIQNDEHSTNMHSFTLTIKVILVDRTGLSSKNI